MGRTKKKRFLDTPVWINKDNNRKASGILKRADNPPTKEQINSKENEVNNISNSNCISSNSDINADIKSESETVKIIKHPLEYSLVIIYYAYIISI